MTPKFSYNYDDNKAFSKGRSEKYNELSSGIGNTINAFLHGYVPGGYGWMQKQINIASRNAGYEAAEKAIHDEGRYVRHNPYVYDKGFDVDSQRLAAALLEKQYAGQGYEIDPDSGQLDGAFNSLLLEMRRGNLSDENGVVNWYAFQDRVNQMIEKGTVFGDIKDYYDSPDLVGRREGHFSEPTPEALEENEENAYQRWEKAWGRHVDRFQPDAIQAYKDRHGKEPSKELVKEWRRGMLQRQLAYVTETETEDPDDFFFKPAEAVEE